MTDGRLNTEEDSMGVRVLTFVFVVLVAGCGDNNSSTPDSAPAPAIDAAAPIAAMAACAEYGYRDCDAVKECGGGVDACTQRWSQLCAAAAGEITADEVAACTSALQAHGCDGTTPTFADDAKACLARFGGTP